MTLSEFRSINTDVAQHIDVLIQHSENFYAVCKKLAKTDEDEDGRSALMLTRQAVGNELVSRLYRLIKNDVDGINVPLLISYLNDDELLVEMMPTFNHDGRKSIQDLYDLRGDILARFEDVGNSLRFQQLIVYRARYIAHRVPQPGVLKKARAEADVHELSAADLRWLSDNLSIIVDKIAYMIDRSGFPADNISHAAEDQANALWGLPAPSRRHYLSEVLQSSKD